MVYRRHISVKEQKNRGFHNLTEKGQAQQTKEGALRVLSSLSNWRLSPSSHVAMNVRENVIGVYVAFRI